MLIVVHSSKTLAFIQSQKGLVKRSTLPSLFYSIDRSFVYRLAFYANANGSKIPVGLIYKGELHDLQDTWVKEVDNSNEVYFAVLESG
jgi:hypothetical protein